MASSLGIARHLLASGTVTVLVSDFDGVLRVFDQRLWEQIDAHLGTRPGTSFSAVLQHPYLSEVVRGRGTHAQWRRLAAHRLVEAGADAQSAHDAVDLWAGTAARVDPEVHDLLTEARRDGLGVFVFTNGTDRVPAELAELGLDDVIGADCRWLINSADLGHAKPEREAFALAHQVIESRLSDQTGNTVRIDPQQVLFLDDSARNVDAAVEFGWQSVQHPRSA